MCTPVGAFGHPGLGRETVALLVPLLQTGSPAQELAVCSVARCRRCQEPMSASWASS